MLSMITPPICIAAFAGAAIAGARPMRTGYACMRLGIIAYIIPFIFVLDPLLLLQGPPLVVALALITATLGTFAVGVGIVGYLARPVDWTSRLLLLAGGVGLLIPPGGAIAYSTAINVLGAVVCVGIIFREWKARSPKLVSRKVVRESG